MSSRRIRSQSQSNTSSARRVSGTKDLSTASNKTAVANQSNAPSAHADLGFRGRRPNGRLMNVLPFLLFPGLLWTFFLGNFGESLAIVAGIALLFAGAWFVKRGIEQEARLDAGQILLPSRLPNKAIGAGLYGLGIFLASAFVARFGIGMGVLYAAVTVVAVLVRYGTDKVPEQSEAIRRAELSGVDIAAVMKSVQEAKGRIAAIRSHSTRLESRAYREQVERIAEEADAVIGQIERDPRDIRSARKFLISYLKRAEEVTQRYADRQQLVDAKQDDDMKRKFEEALDDLETVFQEQNAKLLANDSLDLEVKLDVLSQRLKSEGAG